MTLFPQSTMKEMAVNDTGLSVYHDNPLWRKNSLAKDIQCEWLFCVKRKLHLCYQYQKVGEMCCIQMNTKWHTWIC
jgi:hypothetical protein